jgi:hypothetical protein
MKMIEILKLDLINKGSLIARFTIKLHKWAGLVIRDLTFFDSGGNKWINFPSKEYESEGKKKYFQYIAYENQDLDKKFKESILKEVLAYLDKMKATMPQTQQNNEEELPF